MGNKALVVTRSAPPILAARLARPFPNATPLVSAFPLEFANKLRPQNWIVKP
ncbi:MAG TPA: hypothetical protein VNY29_20655 [Terriglobales bacterium]|nr:hypothetical protein [Terriglobales bacterium]